MTETIADKLTKLAELQRSREKTYGFAYQKKGHVMQALFDEPVNLGTENSYNRFGILNLIVSKIIRYAENFDDGGHRDSLDDISVYAQILAELDEEENRD